MYICSEFTITFGVLLTIGNNCIRRNLQVCKSNGLATKHEDIRSDFHYDDRMKLEVAIRVFGGFLNIILTNLNGSLYSQKNISKLH